MLTNDMDDSLLSSMQTTESAPDARFASDIDYHVKAGLIEQALRDVGALPQPASLREERPYDDDIRKLIMSVTVE